MNAIFDANSEVLALILAGLGKGGCDAGWAINGYVLSGISSVQDGWSRAQVR